jgi:hypothetical protein
VPAARRRRSCAMGIPIRDQVLVDQHCQRRRFLRHPTWRMSSRLDTDRRSSKPAEGHGTGDALRCDRRTGSGCVAVLLDQTDEDVDAFDSIAQIYGRHCGRDGDGEIEAGAGRPVRRGPRGPRSSGLAGDTPDQYALSAPQMTKEPTMTQTLAELTLVTLTVGVNKPTITPLWAAVARCRGLSATL